jgi:hypothetical protein
VVLRSAATCRLSTNLVDQVLGRNFRFWVAGMSASMTGVVKVSVRRPIPARATCDGRHPKTFTIQARLPECPVQSARRAPLDDRDGAEQTSMRHGTLEERAMIEFLAGSVLDWQNQSSIRLLQRDGARGVQ